MDVPETNPDNQEQEAASLVADRRAEYEKIQLRHCDDSRRDKGLVPGRAGQRLVRNITEAITFFKDAGNAVLDVGAGDGWGLHCFDNMGMPAHGLHGIEVTEERVKTAQSYGLNVVKGFAEDRLTIAVDNKWFPPKLSIFCSHTLEHVTNMPLVISSFQHLASLIWIIVPIQETTRNKAHFNPIPSLPYISDHFDKAQWDVVFEDERRNHELEGVIAFKAKF